MKILNVPIMSFQKDEFYFPIRDKIDYARVLLLSAKLILLRDELHPSDCNSNIKLVVDQMSRLFFYTEGKFYSISFPFKITIPHDAPISIKTYLGVDVDSQSISACFSILNDENFIAHPSPVDYCTMTNGDNLLGLNMLEEIFLAEPSYIRYDNDPAHENGKLHPLDHLDINYSNYGTYKLGLKTAIKQIFFEDLLNLSTDCSYLE